MNKISGKWMEFVLVEKWSLVIENDFDATLIMEWNGYVISSLIKINWVVSLKE